MRTKILISITVVLFAASFSNLHAQTESKKREVGIQLGGLNFDGSTSFNGLYRKQKRENVYRRIRATFGNISFVSIDDEAFITFNAGISIGREKRKMLDRQLEFYRGPEFSASVSLLTLEGDGIAAFNVGFGYIFGLQHSFNELWAVHLEAVPSIGVSFATGGNIDNVTVIAGAGVSSAFSLGIVRKF